MARFHLLPLVLAAALAPAPALAQSTPNDALQRMYDAPLKRLYDDPMKKYFPDPAPPPSAARPPSIYPDNPLIPGGQPQAPRTFNQAAPAPGSGTAPGVVTGHPSSGSQPSFDSRLRHLDANKDGRISRQEYVRSNLQRAPVHPSVRDLQAESLRRRFDSRFSGADADGDGQVGREEFEGVTNPRF